jgi:hypothetical protein
MHRCTVRTLKIIIAPSKSKPQDRFVIIFATIEGLKCLIAMVSVLMFRVNKSEDAKSIPLVFQNLIF